MTSPQGLRKKEEADKSDSCVGGDGLIWMFSFGEMFQLWSVTGMAWEPNLQGPLGSPTGLVKCVDEKKGTICYHRIFGLHFVLGSQIT